MRLDKVLARIYASEVNVSISTFWDGGWDVKLGDEINGYVAETTVMNEGFGAAESERSMGRIAEWLDGQMRQRFPDSMYARCSRWCCYVEDEDGTACGEPATVEILALRYEGAITPDGGAVVPVDMAGPDRYSDDTHSCDRHIGDLLTFQPDAIETSNVYWQVRTFAPAMLG